MRKLAVTVFVMSLTLVGCGSSSSSKKDAAPSPDAQITVDGGKLDVTPVTPDTRPADTGLPSDTRVADTAPVVTDAKLDVSGDVTPSDARDGSTPDTIVRLDVKLDVAKLDTNPDTSVVVTTDAPVDSAAASDDAEGIESDAGSDAE